MRALGVDFGEKRIGLAVSDPEGRLAVPLATVARRDDRSAVRRIAEISAREGVERLVVGRPRALDGARGEACERVERFARKLARATGLPLEWVDEELTTFEARDRLRCAGLGRSRKPVDELAAQILLQEALDRRR